MVRFFVAMRKIPTTMATQHPDNAGKPFWHHQAFISTAAEIKESYICFSDLGIDEYNWDWEGKFVDEAVVDRLLHKHLSYFKRHPLGEDKFLTFRIPNPRVEKQFRLARAFMVAITSSQLVQSLDFRKSPIFEMILPLTETADEIIDIQEAFAELVSLEHRLLKMEDSIQNIELIPLFEQVDKIMQSGEILVRYIKQYSKRFGKKPAYIRPYCARSDPALNSGLIPTMLALKVALTTYADIEKKTGVGLYPMVGTGSLPFRGSVTPDSIESVLDEYAGVSTLIIQSAFRYDYKKAQVIQAIEKIKKELPKRKAKILQKEEMKAIRKSIPWFENPYQSSIERLAPLINILSVQVTKRRERMQHIGLFGYSRGVGKVSLPRAIPFTATLYSLGVPPEIIGTGRGIRRAKKEGVWDIIEPIYVNMKDDLQKAGFYVNRSNIDRLAKKLGGWYDLKDDIDALEEIGLEVGPKSASDFEHRSVTDKVFEKLEQNKNVSQLITYGGMLRKSLG